MPTQMQTEIVCDFGVAERGKDVARWVGGSAPHDVLSTFSFIIVATGREGREGKRGRPLHPAPRVNPENSRVSLRSELACDCQRLGLEGTGKWAEDEDGEGGGGRISNIGR